MTSAASHLAIILAAGEGTRMKSAQPKVLHEVAGLSLVGHAIRSAQAAGMSHLAVVIGPDRPDVAREVALLAPDATVLEQRERRGTAHAVLQAEALITKGHAAVLVQFGDTPLIRAETLRALAEAVTTGGNALAVLGFEAKDPTGYGRLLMGPDGIEAIREHKDASEEQRRITLCNGGLMALRGDIALSLLKAVKAENAQNEYYLPDCVGLARAAGERVALVEVAEEEALGVNDRVQLAACERVIQHRLREQHLRNGVTMIAPETVFLSLDTELGRDVLVEPNVVFGPGVAVGEGAVIHAFSHLEGASVGAKATIGPYARLRPGTRIGAKAKIGNFVEIKNAELGEGAKASHLTYLGDARIGAETNIGAGTITCNYDGFLKFETVIGANAFIGSNSALVAPVTIGDGAFVGSGSVITENVPANALALARGHQAVKAGWADAFRARPENIEKARKDAAKKDGGA
ncbi:bifunctional UDP-N-acetylglucosamine diphosphorylase/glucosamine-1-phosphate N-acetyltransferase GlmU [Rhabdaerophilum sp. SD176]|uniref:bifunctional UDP-N-acetylglucosamine diphosphorylase/glucosamine-1-phosphate N-acetyltransferase GlmU n=1 Tax=Rhabdaerophilum sp. SD176 TaxID=2983548 RepID=UPI0024DFF514|nr:bifunctional UDP-N-acetylglucosamine diphosphorylase/glucosamine-1-phosphate N-acetyltransferase GlmU [Rhabdaerophilum sp. SD176]